MLTNQIFDIELQKYFENKKCVKLKNIIFVNSKAKLRQQQAVFKHYGVYTTEKNKHIVQKISKTRDSKIYKKVHKKLNKKVKIYDCGYLVFKKVLDTY